MLNENQFQTHIRPASWPFINRPEKKGFAIIGPRVKPVTVVLFAFDCDPDENPGTYEIMWIVRDNEGKTNAIQPTDFLDTKALAKHVIRHRRQLLSESLREVLAA